MRIAITRGRHRLDDISGVLRMIVAVITDEAAFLGGRSEETLSVWISFERELSVQLPHSLMAREKLTLTIELKGFRIFLLVCDVGCGAGGDKNGPCRQFYRVSISRAESQRAHALALVEQRFFRIHVFDESN